MGVRFKFDNKGMVEDDDLILPQKRIIQIIPSDKYLLKQGSKEGYGYIQEIFCLALVEQVEGDNEIYNYVKPVIDQGGYLDIEEDWVDIIEGNLSPEVIEKLYGLKIERD